MDVRAWQLPFRVGTTSYIVEDDLLPNARFLAPVVQDMQLVLFEVPGGPTNLPAPSVVAALAALGHAQDLTYTVHLLHDLRLADGADEPSLALRKAQEVIELTQALRPWAYVGHLDGRAVADGDLAAWEQQARAAVARAAGWLEAPRQLAIENLEGYAPGLVAPVVAATGVGRCVDVGHLWLDGEDAAGALRAALPWLRVVHLHGVAGSDHAALAHTAPAQLDAVMGVLLDARFDGVVTLEVFGQADFWSSLEALQASIERLHNASERLHRASGRLRGVEEGG
jgi:sugar phosphate isomerase/epimerase